MIDRTLEEALGIREHEGYEGIFTRNQAPGAITNGTRVIKQNSEHRDGTPDGTFGTVLGSIKPPPPLVRQFPYFYFVEWDNRPKMAVGVLAQKIRPIIEDKKRMI